MPPFIAYGLVLGIHVPFTSGWESLLIPVFKPEEFSKLINPTYLVEKPYSANEQTILIDFEVTVPEHEPVIYKWKSKLDN